MSPVFSARVWTRGTFDFAFGRLEVRAKLPRGDWLWPGEFFPVSQTSKKQMQSKLFENFASRGLISGLIQKLVRYYA